VGKAKNRKNFSSFTLKTAMQHLGIQRLHPWSLEVAPRTPTPFFHERLQRLRTFDTVRTERAKELLVDAYCEEALLAYPDLKMWKSAPLTDDDLTGVVDYLLTPQRDYIDTPMLCIVEAKKDDFEQGLAQCLVEMYACRQLNARQGIYHPLYAIVTNGAGWQFYRYEDGQVFESVLFTRADTEKLLGVLDCIFAAGAANARRVMQQSAPK
jgi:hypothetical protein